MILGILSVPGYPLIILYGVLLLMVDIRQVVEDKSITNDRNNSTKNDKRKARLKNKTTKARGDLKRSILINEVT